MADYQPHTRKLSLKVVYYGPALSGKTTNLKHVFSKVPGHLRATFRVVDDRDRTLASGKDLQALRAEVAPQARASLARAAVDAVIAGLAATAVFGLILTWNEFLFSLLLSGVETRTVPVAMAQNIGGEAIGAALFGGLASLMLPAQAACVFGLVATGVAALCWALARGLRRAESLGA